MLIQTSLWREKTLRQKSRRGKEQAFEVGDGHSKAAYPVYSGGRNWRWAPGIKCVGAKSFSYAQFPSKAVYSVNQTFTRNMVNAGHLGSGKET